MTICTLVQNKMNFSLISLFYQDFPPFSLTIHMDRYIPIYAEYDRNIFILFIIFIF